jgi:hypothetical protein
MILFRLHWKKSWLQVLSARKISAVDPVAKYKKNSFSLHARLLLLSDVPVFYCMLAWGMNNVIFFACTVHYSILRTTS